MKVVCIQKKPYLQFLIFNFFPRNIWPDTFCQCWAVPSQPLDHEDEQPIHSQPHCTHTTFWFFTFTTISNKLHEIFNTATIRIFVLDDFA